MEFPAESIGMAIECPHCGKMTEFTLAAAPQEPTINRRTLVWTIIAGAILAIGVVGLLTASKLLKSYAAKHRKNPAAVAPSAADTQQPVANPASASLIDAAPADDGFHVSAVTLEKARDNSLVYAVGTLTNATKRQRFGVKIELDLFNATGEKVGMARDYQSVLDPGGQWHFKALVVDLRAVSAKVAGIKEE